MFEKYKQTINNKISVTGKNKMVDQPGCYVVLHKSSNKVYVGSTSSLSDRVNSHLTELRRGKHKNKPLRLILKLLNLNISNRMD